METGCFLQHFITKGVIAGIVEHDFFYYTDVFLFYIHLINEFVTDRRNVPKIL